MGMTMQNKLLPCPFCGGEAKIVKYCGTKIISYVECTNCLAYMGNQRIMTSSLRGKEYFESEEKLINAWNTRKPMGDVASKVQQVIWDSCSGDEYKYASKEIEKIFDEVYVEGGVDNAE